MAPFTRQFALFTAIGAIGFAVDGGLMTAISEYGSLNAMQARPFSFAVAVTVTWQLNRKLAFSRSSAGSVGEWARYAVVNSVGALINLIVFYLLMLAVPPLRRFPLVALAIAAAVALASNFLGAKRLVFERQRPALRANDAACCAARPNEHGH